MNNTITGDEPATPCVIDENSRVEYHGLTIRQEFAARAMQGYAATGNTYGTQDLVEASVCTADALIAELNKPKT